MHISVVTNKEQKLKLIYLFTLFLPKGDPPKVDYIIFSFALSSQQLWSRLGWEYDIGPRLPNNFHGRWGIQTWLFKILVWHTLTTMQD